MNLHIAQDIRDQRRDRILQAARAVFFEEGFSNATMSMIAARLGGSKATLYAYFRNKEDLFDAIVCDQCSVLESTMLLHQDDADIRATLTELGREMLTAISSDQAVRTLQLIIEESTRNPDLAQRFDEAAPKQACEKIAAYLAKAGARGDIDVPDPDHAAGVLASLFRGDLHFRRILGLEAEPSAEVIAQEVDAAVNIFLAAYAPKVRPS